MAKRSVRKNTEDNTERSFAVAIDRIENDRAVMIACDDDTLTFNLPLGFLPKEVAEGDHFILRLTPDAERREQTENRVAQLQEDLTAARDSEPEQTDIKL